jgi:hypothetical protein
VIQLTAATKRQQGNTVAEEKCNASPVASIRIIISVKTMRRKKRTREMIQNKNNHR